MLIELLPLRLHLKLHLKLLLNLQLITKNSRVMSKDSREAHDVTSHPSTIQTLCLPSKLNLVVVILLLT